MTARQLRVYESLLAKRPYSKPTFTSRAPALLKKAENEFQYMNIAIMEAIDPYNASGFHRSAGSPQLKYDKPHRRKQAVMAPKRTIPITLAADPPINGDNNQERPCHESVEK